MAKQEFALFYKVENTQKLTVDEINRKMKLVTLLLNKKFKGKHKFFIIDIKKNPSN